MEPQYGDPDVTKRFLNGVRERGVKLRADSGSEHKKQRLSRIVLICVFLYTECQYMYLQQQNNSKLIKSL